jgi:ZIP family zinc transporter
MLVASITLHNIPEGLAIGVAFGSFALTQDATALRLAWMLAVGIALQNFPEGAAVSLPLRRDGFSSARAFMAGQFSAVVEPLSALAGVLLSAFVQPILPFLLCFAAGAMICVVISELIPECMRNPHRMFMTQAFTAGFTLMMILDVALS